MTEVSCVLCVLLLTFLHSPATGDAEVSCVFKESCLLPCSFQGGADPVVHWVHLTADSPVHSYFHHQDQLLLQDQRFRGRTSLFQDQISSGNASLQLTEANLQDQGRYKCSTSTVSGNKESFISLKVDAPVREVHIQQVGNRLSCSSEGIYPEPKLTWSTDPPSGLISRARTTVQETGERLHNIHSYVTVSEADLDYSCTVSTCINKRRVTLFKPASLSSSGSEATLSCSSSNTPHTGLTWRFDHSQVILTQTSANSPETVSEEWRQRVERVSESGSLTLKDLSSGQEGTYSCERRDADDTKITNTFLQITDGSTYEGRRAVQRDVVIAVGVVGGILVLVLIGGLAAFFIHRKGKGQRAANGEDPPPAAEAVPLQNINEEGQR